MALGGGVCVTGEFVRRWRFRRGCLPRNVRTMVMMRVSSTWVVGWVTMMASPGVSSLRNLVPSWPCTVVPLVESRPVPLITTIDTGAAGGAASLSRWRRFGAPSSSSLLPPPPPSSRSSRSRLCFLDFFLCFLLRFTSTPPIISGPRNVAPYSDDMLSTWIGSSGGFQAA